MNRRQFLSVIVSGLGAGCTAAPAGVSTSTSQLDEDSTTSETSSDLQRRVELTTAETISTAYDFEVDIQMVRKLVTESETAHVRIDVMNTGEPRATSLGVQGVCGPFNHGKGESTPEGLYLHDRATTEEIKREEDRWLRDRPADEPRTHHDFGCGNRVYEQGESNTYDYWIWDDYRVDGYLVPDTYRFETEITLYDSATTAVPEGADTNTFTLGFSVSVEKPDT